MFCNQTTAAFRRLCVETQILLLAEVVKLPAAFRRLCVETELMCKEAELKGFDSRLQAAVC